MTTQITNIILNSLTLLCSIVQVCVSIYIIGVMILCRQIIREHRIDYLLHANTYIAGFFIALLWIDMCSYSIYGYMYIEISFDGWWCKIKGYLLYIGGTTFFHTFALQAMYRLCRILYRTQIKLQSFRLYIILSISLWIFAFFELLPSFLIGDVKYIPEDYHCQFSLTSIRGSFTIYSLGFIIPFSLTLLCYIWTMYNIRKQTVALVTINQRIGIQRDITIMKRLVIFLFIVIIVGAPHIYLPTIYIITGYLPSWIVSLEWSLTSSALLSVSIISIFISPHLKSLWNRPQPIRRITVVTR